MKYLILPFAIGASAITSGCATVTRGVHDELMIISEPTKAAVTMSNGQTCTTPCNLKLPRNTQVAVNIAKSGYKTATVQVKPVLAGEGAAMTAGNLIVGGVVGITVDAVSGAAMDLKPNPVQVTLQRK